MTDIVANRRAFLKGLAVAPVAAVVPAFPAPAYAAVGEVGPVLPTGKGLSYEEAEQMAARFRKVTEQSVQRGFLSLNEARAIEGLPPMVLA